MHPSLSFLIEFVYLSPSYLETETRVVYMSELIYIAYKNRTGSCSLYLGGLIT